MTGKTTMLMILDGWGISPDREGNAVRLAKTPCLDGIMERYPNTRLVCSGDAVGLPAGIMGNSEVGHLNIGAGRVVFQDLLRIDRSIEDGSFFANTALNTVMDRVKAGRSTLHLMGLVSDGGVHSQLSHLTALLEMAREKGVDDVCVHAILDGRDTPPDSGEGYIRALDRHIRSGDLADTARIATICGRFYAMDRDKRWERIRTAYRLYTRGEGVAETDPAAAVRAAYGRGETDEFVKPIVIRTGKPGAPGRVSDGDGMIFFNFRADRAREITRAFTDPSFDGFERDTRPALCDWVCMTLFDETFTLPVAYPPIHLDQILGEVVSQQGRQQLRIAETEKYAHVTYFFNGGEERAFPGEDRCLIDSPRDVPTYDLKPEMSAPAVTREVIARVRQNRYGLIVLNFANMDMVGHTGVLEAAVRAAETVDRCAGEILAEMSGGGHAVLVTADHGNAEKMIAPDGKPYTAHTTHEVPLVLVDDTRRDTVLRPGRLADIAPTILEIMGIEQPEQMTGRSLLRRPGAA